MKIRAIGSYSRLLSENKLLFTGAIILLIFLLLGVAAPLLAPHDPLEQNPANPLQSGFWAGNYKYLLGTDTLGRCILSRMIFGTRVSLLVGFIAVSIMIFFGTLFGLIAGYYGGTTDNIILRVADVFLAFPDVLLAIGLMAALGPGIVNAMIALGLVFTPRMIRVVRAACLSVKENEYVEAARAVGCPTWRILLFYFLPNIAVDITTYSAISTGQAILYIAALGFLGLGAQPPTPEWGAMISTGSEYLVIGKWWPSLFPGITIFLVVMGFILFGHGLRDALDPRLK